MMQPGSRSGVVALARTAAFCLTTVAIASAQDALLHGHGLVSAMRQGGYVLVMRHASSPGKAPERAAAQADNLNDERELDQSGIESARAMGRAIRQLKIPIGEIESSATYRALQTLRCAGLSASKALPELGDSDATTDTSAAARRAAWLKHRVDELPAVGTNTLLVTHAPNILAAFGPEAEDIAEGEVLMFKPDGKGSAALVARIKIQDWPALAEQEVHSP